MRKGIIVILWVGLMSPVVFSQKLTTEEYITKYKDAAIESMAVKKIPASITLAQGILESGNGNSDLAVKANNHFGIKCHKEWTGDTYHKDDDAPNECFRKYNSVTESFKDHGDFLTSRSRYSKCFELEITNYSGWAKELKAAGYATSPTYAESLIGLIEKYELFKYDQPDYKNTAVATNTTTNSNNTNTGTTTNTATVTSTTSDQYEILMNNGLRTVKIKTGQTKAKIAEAFGLKVKQLERYNEIGAADEFKAGEVMFLEPKKYSASKGNETHTVKDGDTYYSISQLYGVKMESLMKRNNAWYGSPLKSGDTINLRRKKAL